MQQAKSGYKGAVWRKARTGRWEKNVKGKENPMPSSLSVHCPSCPVKMQVGQTTPSCALLPAHDTHINGEERTSTGEKGRREEKNAAGTQETRVLGWGGGEGGGIQHMPQCV